MTKMPYDTRTEDFVPEPGHPVHVDIYGTIKWRAEDLDLFRQLHGRFAETGRTWLMTLGDARPIEDIEL